MKTIEFLEYINENIKIEYLFDNKIKKANEN